EPAEQAEPSDAAPVAPSAPGVSSAASTHSAAIARDLERDPPRYFVLGTPWGGLSATMSRNEIVGARAHAGLDILRDRGLAAGLMVGEAVTRFSLDPTVPEGPMSYYRSDLRALATMSLTYSTGSWQLRAQIGAGGVWSHVFRRQQ